MCFVQTDVYYIMHLKQPYAVLYFFYYEGKIIMTNGFVKKTQKTPKEEIQIAKDRRKDFIERVMKDENI